MMTIVLVADMPNSLDIEIWQLGPKIDARHRILQKIYQVRPAGSYDAAGVVPPTGANLKISCSAFFNTPNPSSCDDISSIPVLQDGTVMTLINIRPVGRVNFRTNDCKHIPDIFRVPSALAPSHPL